MTTSPQLPALLRSVSVRLRRARLLLALCGSAALCGLSTSPVAAQEASLRRADGFFEAQDYHTAARLYEQILQSDPKSGIAQLKAGISYLFTAQQEKGLAYIRRAGQMPLEMSPYYHFWLGRAYHLNMRIDSALVNYRKYMVQAPANDEFRRQTQELIAQAHRTESYFVTEGASPFQAVNLGEAINSPFTERGPIVTPDGRLLIFTTRRPLSPDEPIQPDGEYLDKGFIAVRGADGNFQKAVALHPPNDRRSYFRPVQLVAGGTRLLMVRLGKNAGLFVSEREGDTFGQPRPIDEPIPGVRYQESDVYFSDDMNRAVFARLGRGDQAEIFMTTRNSKGAWARPRRLKELSSRYDDIAPTFAEGGAVITYASKDPAGLGGFDIYRSRQDARGNWPRGENMGLPINSPGNDIGYLEAPPTVGQPQRVAYLSSARAGGFGEADIYRILYTEPAASGN